MSRSFQPDRPSRRVDRITERALRRGRVLHQRDLRDAGGAYTEAQADALLSAAGLKSAASLRLSGDLLAVPVNCGYIYPAFQFVEGRPLPGLRQVFAALDVDDARFQLHWLLRDASLFGKAPIDLLNAGEIGKAVAAARAYGSQTAY